MSSVKLSPLKDEYLSKDVQTISIPGCLSYTIRALLIAATISGTICIKNALKSDDTEAMVKILQTLGIEVEETTDSFLVHGDISHVKDGNYELFVNLSGRTARFILPFLCLVPGTKTLTGAAPFLKRPMGDLVQALQDLGAKIEYLGETGHLPVEISSNKLNSGKISMQGHTSAQFFGAILAVAPLFGGVEIDVIGKQASQPFIDMTIDVMKYFGVNVENKNYTSYSVKPNQNYIQKDYTVEADAMSASYFWAVAALTGQTIRVGNLDPDSAQGDVRFVDILGKMGCEIQKNAEEKWIQVRGTGVLQAIDIDMSSFPDTALIIMVLAGFASGMTKITNIGHLRGKESNRIECPATELRKMGLQVETTEDSITIFGGKPLVSAIDTYHDHRMAMSFAICGGVLSEMIINDSEVVSKSFPEFWQVLQNVMAVEMV